MTLPSEFRPFFWDTDFDGLDTRRHCNFIIIRLYCKGDMEGIRWVHMNYTDAEVRHAACVRRDMNPIVANYLMKKYALNREEMRYYTYNGDAWRNALRNT